jgi:hypothetical protein
VATIKKSCNSLSIMFCNSGNTVIVLILVGIQEMGQSPISKFYLGIFGIINKPSIRKCLKRIPQYVEFSLDYFSEFAIKGNFSMQCVL